MKKPSIALAMIVKGNKEEATMLQRCLNSIAPFVDGIFITLTNPNKKQLNETKDVCEKYGVNTDYFKWVGDFSKARNHNFAQVPKEFDWILWLDADDVFRGGEKLAEVAKRAADSKADCVFFNYLYQVQLDEKTGEIRQVLIEHLRERLIKNTPGLYKWIAPIHETLIEQTPTKKVDDPSCDVVHLSGDERRGKALTRNIEILEKNVKETEGKDPRPVYYLGKAYFDMRTTEYMDKAWPLFEKYLGASGWAEERAQCWEYLNEICRARKQYNNAIKCCMNALIEYPEFPSFYFNLALNYLYKEDWDRALFWVKKGASMPLPKTTLVLNPRDYAARALEIVYNASLKKSKLDDAWAAAIKLADMFPGDKSVLERVNFCDGLKKQRDLTQQVISIAGHLKKSGEEAKLKPLIAAIPTMIENNPFIADLQNKVNPPVKWKENEIVIYCGPGFTSWSPMKLVNPGETFMGGSEEATVYIAQELAKKGWRVTVYADPGEDEGVIDGVDWKPYYKFNHKDDFNILIGWRNLSFFDGNYKAKKKYVWAHDVLNPLEYTKERLRKIDKIIVLSDAHRRTIPDVADDKILVSTNGFHEYKEHTKVVNNPKWVIYTSSYDRGLEHLLKIWPDVVKEVPEAKLHVFYGWQLFQKFYADNPERMEWKSKLDKMMEDPTITHHGRVSQPEMEEWMKKCGIWAYPTHFYEINCITAIKAQLWGCVPVYMNYAALETTAQFGKKVEGEIYDPETKKEFTKQLVEALKDEDWQTEERKKMMPWARDNFAWEKVAAQWTAEFKETLHIAVKTMLAHDKKLGRYLPVQLQKQYGYKQSY